MQPAALLSLRSLQLLPQSTVYASGSIRVIDVNERPRINSYSMVVNENSIPGTAIGYPVSARDEDVELPFSTQTLTFSLFPESNTTAMPFTIDPLSGQVSVARGVLDFERQREYNVVLVVTDTGTPPLSANSTLNITLRCGNARVCL